MKHEVEFTQQKQWQTETGCPETVICKMSLPKWHFMASIKRLLLRKNTTARMKTVQTFIVNCLLESCFMKGMWTSAPMCCLWVIKSNSMSVMLHLSATLIEKTDGGTASCIKDSIRVKFCSLNVCKTGAPIISSVINWWIHQLKTQFD